MNSKRLPAEASSGATGRPFIDDATVKYNILKYCREVEELKAKNEELKRKLESLQQDEDEYKEGIVKASSVNVIDDLFLKTQDINQTVEKIEEEKEEKLQLEKDIERLKADYAKLMERKLEQQRQMQSESRFQDYMEQLLKKTGFDNVKSLMKYLDGLFQFRESHANMIANAHEVANEQKLFLQKLEDKYNQQCNETDTQLSELKREFMRVEHETMAWEKKTDFITDLEKEKQLNLATVKMTVLSLYQQTEGTVAVDDSDTMRQLEEIANFITDSKLILQQYQSELEAEKERKEESQVKDVVDFAKKKKKTKKR